MKSSSRPNILKIIGQIPAALLIWPLYILPLWTLRQIKLVKKAAPWVLEFELSDEDTRYTKLWKNWAGSSLPFCFIRISKLRINRNNPGLHWATVAKRMRQLVAHELHHNQQQFNLGPLFFPLYLYQLVTKGYQNNPYEVEARRVAGEEE